jgi:S1-C subfamily serine protease
VRQFLARWLSPQILKKQGLGFAVTTEDGAVRVESVSDKSPAQTLGLQPGAIITAVNGQATPDLFTFNQRVLSLSTGDTASITWTTAGGDMRSGDLRVEALRFDDGNDLAWNRLGMRLKPVVDKNVVPLRYEGSLPISEIAQGGSAARAGLTPGRYIWKINDTNIYDLTDVSRALLTVKKGDAVTVGIVNFVESAQNMIAHQTFTTLTAD